MNEFQKAFTDIELALYESFDGKTRLSNDKNFNLLRELIFPKQYGFNEQYIQVTFVLFNSIIRNQKMYGRHKLWDNDNKYGMIKGKVVYDSGDKLYIEDINKKVQIIHTWSIVELLQIDKEDLEDN